MRIDVKWFYFCCELNNGFLGGLLKYNLIFKLIICKVKYIILCKQCKTIKGKKRDEIGDSVRIFWCGLKYKGTIKKKII